MLWAIQSLEGFPRGIIKNWGHFSELNLSFQIRLLHDICGYHWGYTAIQWAIRNIRLPMWGKLGRFCSEIYFRFVNRNTIRGKPSASERFEKTVRNINFAFFFDCLDLCSHHSYDIYCALGLCCYSSLLPIILSCLHSCLKMKTLTDWVWDAFMCTFVPFDNVILSPLSLYVQGSITNAQWSLCIL